MRATRLRLWQVAFILAGSACLTGGVCAEEAPAADAAWSSVRLADAINPDWAAGEPWGDGMAEVATYHAERILDGEARPHTFCLITVAEDLNKQYWTKADWPYGQKPILPVIKQSQIATIQAANFPHHYMASVWFDRARIGTAVKMTVSSQEWIGTTFKEFQLYKNPPVYSWSSYWDEQGTGTTPLTGFDSNVFFEEELHLLVRTLRFRDGLGTSLSLMPSQTTNKAATPEAVPARLTIGYEKEEVKRAQTTYAANALWRVSLEARDGRNLTWDVTVEPPNTLVRFQADDGRHFELEETVRRKYWVIGN